MLDLCAKSASVLFLFSLAQLFGAHHVNAQCYLPNGTVTTDLYHNRCSNDTSNPLNTICCAVDRAPLPGTYSKDGYARDECLDSGICRNRYEDANGRRGVTYWREECTEKDWTTGKCLNVCTDNVNGGTHEMTPCDGTANSTTWCCGNTASCCETLPITIAPKFGVKLSISTSSASASATPATSATPPASVASQSVSSSVPTTTQNTSNSRDSASLSGGGIAGVVIGAIAGTALICTAVFLCIGKRRNGKAADSAPYTPVEKTTYMCEADTVTPQVHEAGVADTKSRTVRNRELPEMA